MFQFGIWYVYIQCSPIKDVTGYIIGTLEAFGLDSAYQRDNVSGCAMDGQYIRLNVLNHLINIFINDYHVTWDPAHRNKVHLMSVATWESCPTSIG